MFQRRLKIAAATAIIFWTFGSLVYGASALKTTRWKAGGAARKRVSIVKTGAKTAEGSLVVTIGDPPVEVTLRSGKVKLTKTRLGYLFSFYYKTIGEASSADMRVTSSFFDTKGKKFSMLQGKNRGKDSKGRLHYRLRTNVTPLVFEETAEGAWARRTYILSVVYPRKNPNKKETLGRVDKVRFTLTVGGAPGKFIFDDFKFGPCPAGFEKRPDRLFWTAPYRRGVGETPSNKLQELQAANSPFLKSAALYHECLALYARTADRYDHLIRAAYYKGVKSKSPFEKRLAAVTEKMESLYQTYGRLYLENRSGELSSKLDPALGSFLDELKALYKKMGEELARGAKHAGASQPKPATNDKPRPVEISPDGRFSRFGIHSWAKEYHLDALKPFGDLYQIIFPRTGSGYLKAFVEDDGSVDVVEYLAGIKATMTKGGRYFIIPTQFASGIGAETVVGKSFYKKHGKEKEFIFQSNLEGKPRISGSTGKARTYVNIFDPKIRAETLKTAGFVAASTGKLPVILITSWEDKGPYFGEVVNGKVTTVIAGYSRHALLRFRGHLKKKFGTVQKLNAELGTSFKSFNEIKQPKVELKNIPRPHPLAHVFLKWVHEYMIDYRVDLYKAFKSARPDAPVMADHSRLLSNIGINPIKLFDTCDILAMHNSSRGRLAQAILFSMTRYKPKTLGCFEEHGHGALTRPGEREKAALKNLVLGRFLNTGHSMYNLGQSYSTGPHSVSWGSNYWANPTYDCTIFRYHTTMIPVALDRIRRLEPAFKATAHAAPRIAMMIPESSMYLQSPGGLSWDQMLETFNLLYPNGFGFEFETEQMLTDGTASLEPYKYLIMPMASFFPRGLWDKITPWVKNGGTLVAIGPCGWFDAYGYDAKDGLTWKLEGKTPFPKNAYSGAASWDWGNRSSLRIHTVGRGKYVAVPKRMESVAKDAQLLNQFMKIFKPRDRKLYTPDTRVELTLRKGRAGDGLYVFALNPHPSRHEHGTISVEGKFTRSLDLDIAGGFPIMCKYDPKTNRSAYRFALAPGAWTMYKLEK